MTINARFEMFSLSPDGREAIYRGLTDARRRVEIRQAAGDLDVMLVLIAQVLEKALAPRSRAETGHQTQAAVVEPMEGGVVLSLVSHGITRSFRLPAPVAGQAAEQIVATLRRRRLRLITDEA